MATTARGAYDGSVVVVVADVVSCRLNKIYRESVGEDEIIAILQPMFKSYALERLDGEHFGDFVIRKGIISATTSGKEFVSRFGSRTSSALISLAPSVRWKLAWYRGVIVDRLRGSWGVAGSNLKLAIVFARAGRERARAPSLSPNLSVLCASPSFIPPR